MVKDNKETIKKIFNNNKGFAKTKDMVSAGIHTRQIKQFRDSGWIIRIRRGLYRLASYQVSNQSFVDAATLIPKGVICLTSALSYYDLTTFIPSVISIAIPRDTRRPSVEYPPIDFYYFSKNQFTLGKTEIRIDNHIVRIYDKEKTICDCFRYRNKIGIDIVKEALSEYLKRNDRNLQKLLKYAEVCRTKPIIETWLQAMV